jgi:long-subunit fatty acid transport protein
MRRLKLLISSLLLGQMAFAGGMVTNTNQSAAYIRMLARDASTDVDAVYYNPAALTKLADGFYVQLNNQTVIQERTIDNTYLGKTYTGDIFVPALPTFFAVYKTGNWAFSGGFTVIGGGGSADYSTGLPDFEYPFKGLLGLVNTIPTTSATGYTAEIAFNGSSVYYGGQAGVTYKINDMISVYGGARYVYAANSYEGSIKNVQFQNLKTGLAPGYDGTGSKPANQFFKDIEPALTSTGNGDQAKALIAATEDRVVDVEQFGSGITPIIGVNIALMEDRLNIGLKYEFATKMEVENYTYQDDTKGMPGMPNGMFPDGETVKSDMPAFLSVGIGYKILEDFYVTAGFHYYWDKNVDYGKRDPSHPEWIGNEYFIDDNSYEIALGLQYDISEKISLSGGYLHASSSPALNYQSGMSYALSSNTFSFGAIGHISERFDIDLGILYTAYDDAEKSGDYYLSGNPIGSYTETYDKSNVVFAIGATYHFGGAKK